MARFVLSPRAQADIDEIWNYTVERWGVEQAELYVRQLGSAVEAIAQDPKRGRPCDEIRKGYRRYPSGSHVVFYRVMTKEVIVVRVLHQRMDFNRHV
ncbi:MAG: type II toxin-antitoxin system RelE/ParE family toxin [Rhodospirillaceae bacterium]|nr:type II toxin-antitoxin system RelE/ParE family toxin [Rhodospirillaceae bacterium]